MRQRFTLVALGLLILGGCKRQPFDLVPVSGRVTWKDQPVANAVVHFQPLGENPGPGSSATTDSEGRFTLRVASQQVVGEGAVVGKHRVSIGLSSFAENATVVSADTGTEDGTPLPKRTPGAKDREMIPPEYNQDSVLTFDVPKEGTTNANFDLPLK